MNRMYFTTVFALSLSLGAAACGAPVQLDDSGSGADATVRDSASVDVPNATDMPTMGNDVPSGADVMSNTDVPSGQDVPSVRDVPNVADSGSVCVAPNGRCDIATNNCCPGSSCINGVAGPTCAQVGMCSMNGGNCAAGAGGSPCCAGLVCMQAGGIGGMRCASPMCRRVGQSCDDMNPCCPSSACGGGGAGRMCLPTP